MACHAVAIPARRPDIPLIIHGKAVGNAFLRAGLMEQGGGAKPSGFTVIRVSENPPGGGTGPIKDLEIRCEPHAVRASGAAPQAGDGAVQVHAVESAAVVVRPDASREHPPLRVGDHIVESFQSVIGIVPQHHLDAAVGMQQGEIIHPEKQQITIGLEGEPAHRNALVNDLMPAGLWMQAVDHSRLDVGPVEALAPAMPKRILAELAVAVDQNGGVGHGMGV